VSNENETERANSHSSQAEENKVTNNILGKVFEQITEFKIPFVFGFAFGDFGVGSAARVGTAIWLCKNAGVVIKEVADNLEGKNKSTNLTSTKLAQDIIEILNVETRHLPDQTRLEYLAQLMISLGVGVLPSDTDWTNKLRGLAESRLDPSTEPILRWAISIELDGANLSLQEREDSFYKIPILRFYEVFKLRRKLVALRPDHEESQHIKRDKLLAEYLYAHYNSWAYLLLRLGLYRSATPIAKVSFESSKNAAAKDTYGWALFHEGDYTQAENLLSQAIKAYQDGNPVWCEIQYHRLQVAFWSKRLSDARMLLEALQRKAPEDYWTKKATELKPLIVRRKKVSPRKRRGKYEYEVALSFAGEDRGYADQLARSLSERGVTVFYDDYERAVLWGQDLYRHLSEIYMTSAKYCVIFISQYYLSKQWTNLECRAAQARAFQEKGPYILPIKLDDTEIPGILPTVGYMSWEKDGLNLIIETLLARLEPE
jgi:tetratricopeptide (TPR) repeat protein